MALIYDTLHPFQLTMQVSVLMLGYTLDRSQTLVAILAIHLSLKLLPIIFLVICLVVELILLLLRGLRWRSRLPRSPAPSGLDVEDLIHRPLGINRCVCFVGHLSLYILL
jgi:hypothetical protein